MQAIAHKQRAATGTGLSTALYMAVLMATAAALAFLYFSATSLRLDEAQSLWQSGRSAYDILVIVAQDVHVPLYHELLHFWRLTVGDSVAAARALSLILYIVSIPALYMLGALAYSRQVGLFAATLFTISPFMNWYGSEIRMYTLFTLVVIINQYAYIRLLKKPGERTWVAYALSALVGIFTHYFFALIVLSQAVFFYMRRPLFEKAAVRRFIGTWIFLAVCFAPWAAFVALQGQAQNASPVLTPPTTVNLFGTFAQFLFGFQDDHLSTVLLSLWPLAVVAGLLALRKTARMEPVTEYLLLSVVLGVSIAFVASLLIAPLFVSRYLIFTVPAIYLLISNLISIYPARGATVARAGLIGAMGLMLCIEVLSPRTPVKEHYREASEFLTAHATAQDVILISAPFTVYPLEYYYRGAAPIETIPAWDRYRYGPIPSFDESRLVAEVEELTADAEYAWVLFSYDQGYEERIRQHFDTTFERLGRTTFSPGLELSVYKIRYGSPIPREPPTLGAAAD